MLSEEHAVAGDAAPEPRLREARLDDIQAIAEIYNTYVGKGEITFDLDPKPAEFFAAQLVAMQPREAWLVLEDGAAANDSSQSILGYGLIKLYSDRRGYASTGETSVYLRPEHQRRGYGSLIKHALIARCRELGYHHLVARVVVDNAASMEYNRRLGYELVGIQREAGLIDGRWYDVAIMQLILD